MRRREAGFASTPAGRELGFVLAVAAAGLALVLVVVFAPWYSPSSGSSAEAPGLIRSELGSTSTAP